MRRTSRLQDARSIADVRVDAVRQPGALAEFLDPHQPGALGVNPATLPASFFEPPRRFAAGLVGAGLVEPEGAAMGG